MRIYINAKDRIYTYQAEREKRKQHIAPPATYIINMHTTRHGPTSHHTVLILTQQQQHKTVKSEDKNATPTCHHARCIPQPPPTMEGPSSCSLTHSCFGKT